MQVCFPQFWAPGLPHLPEASAGAVGAGRWPPRHTHIHTHTVSHARSRTRGSQCPPTWWAVLPLGAVAKRARGSLQGHTASVSTGPSGSCPGAGLGTSAASPLHLVWSRGHSGHTSPSVEGAGPWAPARRLLGHVTVHLPVSLSTR